MELLLALAGLAGLSLLLQSKSPLPSEDEFRKAKDVLDRDPVNPAANTVVGKYLAFVQGDYSAAMPYLVHSADKTLQILAEHELDPMYADSAVKKIGMGDEWVSAARKIPALTAIFYDRAAQWYGAAWPGLDAVWKQKARLQGRKLAVSRPAGGPRKGLPSGWVIDSGKPPVLDGNVARTGSYSARVFGADDKVAGSSLRSSMVVMSGAAFDLSAFLLTDETENPGDRIYVQFFDATGRMIGMASTFSTVDIPFWTRVGVRGMIPANAVRAQFGIDSFSKKGATWIDDVSLKIDGMEVLPNPSFELR